MKNPLTLAILVSAAAALALSGCSSLDNALLNRQTVVEPQVVRTPVTNSVVAAEVRTVPNSAGVPTTVTNLATNTVVSYLAATNWVTNTLFVPKPQIAQVAQTVETANSMLNPTPSAPLVNLGIEGLLAALAAYAGFRNKRYAAATKAIITGIEDATKSMPALAPIKEAITQSALGNSVSDFVQVLVDKHTRPA
jgi:hypothetical protein